MQSCKEMAGQSPFGKDCLVRIVIVFFVTTFAIFEQGACAEAGWITDKWDVRHEIESDGWKTVYFDEIHSETVLQAAVAAYFGNYAGFSAWFSTWISTALKKFARELEQNVGPEIRDAAEQFLWENVFNDLVNGRLPGSSMENFGSIQIKAGVAEYHGCNTVQIPFSGEEQCWHYELPAIQPYVAIRVSRQKLIEICTRESSSTFQLATCMASQLMVEELRQ